MRRSAVSRPSPVVESPSRKMMWPDCSPPSVAPVLSISSSTYLSPTLARSMRMPDFFSAISRPIFDMVVETTVSAFNFPCACRSRAAARSTPSPLTTRPSASQNRARSASPSKVTPRSNCAGDPPPIFPESRGASAAAFVDVLAIRRNMNERRLNAEAAKQLRSLGGSRSIGAIHQHTQLAQVRRDAPARDLT